MTREIVLTRGYVALVDDGDYADLSKWTWHAAKDRHGFYASGNRGAGRVRMHRAILGALPGRFVDHKNGDRLDNQRTNLRLCTQAENNRNKRRSASKQGFKGVFWIKSLRAWSARICVDGRRITLGSGHDPAVLAQMYDDAAREHFGEFACLNFPGVGERGALVAHDAAPTLPLQPPRLRRGEDSATSKLTEIDVEGINRRYLRGEDRASLGRRYGVSSSTIAKVCNGEAWRNFAALN